VKLEHSFTVPADLDTVWEAVLDPERVAPCMPGATLSEVDGDAFKGSVKVKLGPISLLYKGSGEFLTKDADSRTVVIKASGKDARGNGTAAATVTVTLTAEGSSTTGTVVTDLSITGKPAQFGRGLISEVGGKILDTFAGCLASKLAPAPTLSVVKDPPAEEESSGAKSAAVSESAATTAGSTTAGSTAAGSTTAGSTTAGSAAAGSTTAGSAAAGSAAASESATAAEPAVAFGAAERAEAVVAGRKAGEAAARLVPAPEPQGEQEPETEAIDLLSYAGPSVLKRAAPLIVLVALLVVFGMRRRRR
jgi:carbon monoxide dehydrogenase subunit G